MKNLFKPKPYRAVVTVPNIITVAGFFLLVPYVWCFLTGGNRWLMFGSLFLSGFSDLIDGFLARRLQQKTCIGAIMDPLRDRLICLAILGNIFFLERSQLTISLIVVIIVLELAVFIVSPNRHYDDCDFKVHFIGRLRQAAHLLAGDLAIMAHYFNDVIVRLVGLNFTFPFTAALVAMIIFSSIALMWYTFAEE